MPKSDRVSLATSIVIIGQLNAGYQLQPLPIDTPHRHQDVMEWLNREIDNMSVAAQLMCEPYAHINLRKRVPIVDGMISGDDYVAWFTAHAAYGYRDGVRNVVVLMSDLQRGEQVRSIDRVVETINTIRANAATTLRPHIGRNNGRELNLYAYYNAVTTIARYIALLAVVATN